MRSSRDARNKRIKVIRSLIVRTLLPYYVEIGLDVVLIGLNPSLYSTYSTNVGSYFANPRNRLWPAVNASELASKPLSPIFDYTLPSYGIRLTDLIECSTRNASELKINDYLHWIPVLYEKLIHYKSKIVCFQGLMAYSNYLRHSKNIRTRPSLKSQSCVIGKSEVFVVPNPTPENARFSMDELIKWYQELKVTRDQLVNIQ
ncbi:mismatch-specific DNA-glycosylase [SAR202 cluster bacterium AD-804-J14_MRT_500m]|nr:mismatch-specific DNA-glycosylase [SAR202 cluster bacterium AD-804-J14_MRT_500m]